MDAKTFKTIVDHEDLPAVNKLQYDNLVLIENTRHKHMLDTLKVRLMKHQNKCKHKNTKHVPDASGNNDSYDECLDCGKEL